MCRERVVHDLVRRKGTNLWRGMGHGKEGQIKVKFNIYV